MSSHPSRRRRRMKKFRLDEISMVDRPSHSPARIAIMKRAADAPNDVEPTQIQKRAALTTSVEGHAHSLITSDSTSDLVAGQTSFEVSDGDEFGHSHSWIINEAGTMVIGMANGHTHELDQLSKKGTVSNEPVPTGSAVDNPVGNTAADQLGDSSEDIMSKQGTQAAGKEPDAVTQEQLDEVTKRAERAESIAKMNSEQRAYFDALSPENQDEFLTSEDKDGIVKNAKDADPVVHTDLDGNEIRKSEGPTVLRLAKSNDELRKQAAKHEAIAKRADFAKRADSELGHLTGDDDAKADLLEAVETIPSEKREAVMAILKSKDAGMAKAFQVVGVTGDNNEEGVDANAKIEEIAKGLRKEQPKLTPEQAYVAALDTPEGRELQDQL